MSYIKVMNESEKITEMLKCLELWAKRAKADVDEHPYSTGKINFRSITPDGQMRYKQSYLLEAPSEIQGLAAAHAALFDAFQFSKEIAMESRLRRIRLRREPHALYLIS